MGRKVVQFKDNLGGYEVGKDKGAQFKLWHHDHKKVCKHEDQEGTIGWAARFEPYTRSEGVVRQTEVQIPMKDDPRRVR